MSNLKEYPIKDFVIPAENAKEAAQKAEGLYTLAQLLSGEQLEYTVEFVREKPLLAQYLKEKPINIKKVITYLGFDLKTLWKLLTGKS